MKTTLALAAVIIITIGGAGACSTSTPAGNVNAANATANTANTAPANNATPTAPPAAYGSLATPTEAYKTAYASRKKGDIAVLKTVFSKDVLEFFEMMGEEEKKTLDDMLKDLVKEPQGPNDDVRNEEITGDTATLEYRKDETTWKTMDFIKEGNDWKMTIPKGGAKDKGPKQPE
jgi:hypothetical protein